MSATAAEPPIDTQGAGRPPVAEAEPAANRDAHSETEVRAHAPGQVPRNLALLCERTWQCHPPPLGPDRHPNILGQRVMAEAFARELGLSPVGIDVGSDLAG